MTDRELVAIMASIIAAGVRSNGCEADIAACVDAALELLKAVELGPKLYEQRRAHSSPST